MSKYIHKTIIVTGEQEHLERAYKKAKELFREDEEGEEVRMVSDLIGTGMNQLYSFFISPCGTKANWEMDKYFKKKYNEMIEYLKSSNCNFEDGSSMISWFMVAYGDCKTKIEKTN